MTENQKSWENARMTELVEHILTKHHRYLKSELPKMEMKMQELAQESDLLGKDLLANLQDVLGSLKHELDAHLMKEEQILFPGIVDLEASLEAHKGMPEFHCGSLLNPIRQMEFEHDGALKGLSQMRAMTSDYQLSKDLDDRLGAIYADLKKLDADLQEHIHLENDILFQKVRKFYG